MEKRFASRKSAICMIIFLSFASVIIIIFMLNTCSKRTTPRIRFSKPIVFSSGVETFAACSNAKEISVVTILGNSRDLGCLSIQCDNTLFDAKVEQSYLIKEGGKSTYDLVLLGSEGNSLACTSNEGLLIINNLSESAWEQFSISSLAGAGTAPSSGTLGDSVLLAYYTIQNNSVNLSIGRNELASEKEWSTALIDNSNINEADYYNKASTTIALQGDLFFVGYTSSDSKGRTFPKLSWGKIDNGSIQLLGNARVSNTLNSGLLQSIAIIDDSILYIHYSDSKESLIISYCKINDMGNPASWTDYVAKVSIGNVIEMDTLLFEGYLFIAMCKTRNLSLDLVIIEVGFKPRFQVEDDLTIDSGYGLSSEINLLNHNGSVFVVYDTYYPHYELRLAKMERNNHSVIK